MAEALPRYRRQGVLMADVPRLNFADMREDIRSTQALDENLGRMAKWAFGEAEETAKREGLQYGIDNPVTNAQLRDAVSAGRNPGELFQKSGTVFGDAARSAQVAMAASDIEMDAQAKLNALKLGVESGKVELGEAQKQIQGMLDGYGEVMKGVDPRAALKVRAALGTAANSAYLSMSNSYLKQQTELRKTGVSAWLETTLPEQIRGHIEAGDTTDPETGKTITPQQRINATLRPALLSQLAGIGDATFARQALNDFGKVVSAAQVDALVKVASDPKFAQDRNGNFDPVGAVQRADRGDFGGYSSVYAGMPSTEQAKVRTALRMAAADRWTADQHSKAQLKDEQTLEVNRLVTEYTTANPARARQIQARLGEISGTTGAITGQAINALVKSRRDGDGQANERGEFTLRSEILNGKIRTPEQLWKRSEQLGVRPKQANEVLGFFVSRQNAVERDADRIIRNAARIVPGTVNPSRAQAESYFSLTREVDTQFSKALEAHQADPSKHAAPDRAAIADGVARKRQESGPSRQIEQAVLSLNQSYGSVGTVRKTGVTFTDDMSISEIRAALERDGATKNDILVIEQKLDEIAAARRRLNALRN